MESGPFTSWQIDGEKVETVMDFIFLGSKITVDGDYHHKIKRCLLLGRKAMTNLDRVLKMQRYYFANKSPSSQSYGFSNSRVWMWELDIKKAEGWKIDAFKLWCWRSTPESPLDSKEIKLVNPKGNQPWISIERTIDCWSSNTLATWWEKRCHWKRPWFRKDWR